MGNLREEIESLWSVSNQVKIDKVALEEKLSSVQRSLDGQVDINSQLETRLNDQKKETNTIDEKIVSLGKELEAREEAAKSMISKITDLTNQNTELQIQLDLEKEKQTSLLAIESRNASVQTDGIDTREVSVETEDISMQQKQNETTDIFKDILLLKKNTMNDAMGLLSLLQNHISQTETDNNKLKCNIESFQNRAEKLESSLATKSGAVEQLCAELKAANENIYTYEVKLNKIEGEYIECKEKLAIAQKNEDHQHDVISRLMKEKKHAEAAYDEASRELLVLKSMLTELENEFQENNEESINTRKELAECREEIKLLQLSEKNLTADLESSCEKLIKLQGNTDQQIKKMEEENTAQGLSLKNLEKKIAQANKSLLTKQEIEEILKSKVLFTDQWCKSIEDEIVVKGKENSELCGKLLLLEQHLYYLEEKLEVKESEDRVMKEMLKD